MTGEKVGAERSEPQIGRRGDQTDWREATAAQRDRRWARSTWERPKDQETLRSEKTAEPQRLAAESPLPDLDGQILTQLVQAVLQTAKGKPDPRERVVTSGG